MRKCGRVSENVLIFALGGIFFNIIRYRTINQIPCGHPHKQVEWVKAYLTGYRGHSPVFLYRDSGWKKEAAECAVISGEKEFAGRTKQRSVQLYQEGKYLLEVGSILAYRYEIKGKLGQGGFSQVYFAYDREKRKNCAIKEVEKSRSGQIHNMVRREAELIWKLRYPYFPEMEEIIETDQACYLVMEYLEGESLSSILYRSGSQPVEEVVRWAKDICLMLEYLHNCNPPVIYQDMKPSNIILQSGGNLRLVDFGAAWEERDGQERIILGTRGYAAPEQLDGSGKIDARTDIYGLGATMYHLLTGKDPGEFPCGEYSIRRWNRWLPKRLDRIIWKCTRQDPMERYVSCRELLEELKNFANRKRLW